MQEAYAYSLRKISTFDTSIFEKQVLPPTIYADLINHIYSVEITKLKLFDYSKFCSPADYATFVHESFKMCRPFKLQREKKIFAKGDVCSDIIIVVKGCVLLTIEDENGVVVAGICTEGGYFGDFEMIQGSLSCATYMTLWNSEFYAISHSAFKDIVAKAGSISKPLELNGKKRYDAFKRATASASVKKDNSFPYRTTQKIWMDGYTKHWKECISQVLEGQSHDKCSILLEESNNFNISNGVGVFYPYKRGKMVWNAFISVLIFILLWVIPVDIAFAVTNDGSEMVLELLISFFLIMDILFTFNTAYYSVETDLYVTDRKKIAENYWKNALLIDCVSSISFYGILVWPFTSQMSVEMIQFLKLVKLLQLLLYYKLQRKLKSNTVLSTIEQRIPQTILSLLWLVMYMIYISHIVACIWWIVPYCISRSDAWFDNSHEVFTSTLGDSTAAEKYSFSVYWATATLTTVGYGDIVPQSTGERVVALLLVVSVVTVFGSILSSVAHLLTNANASSLERSEKMLSMVEFLIEKKCPKGMTNKVLRHYRHLFNQKSAYNEEKILSLLPPQLSKEILLIKYRQEIDTIYLFRFIENKSIILYLFHIMSPLFFEANDCIIEEGKESEGILFLVRGRARAIAELPKRYIKPPTKLAHKRSSFSEEKKPPRRISLTSISNGWEEKSGDDESSTFSVGRQSSCASILTQR